MSARVRIPKLVHHKPTGQARVRLAGTDHYLGRYGSPEAEERYRRLIAEHLASCPIPPASQRQDSPSISIVELILAYRGHVAKYYVRPDGSPTNEQANIRHALKILRELNGSTPAAEFGPLSLRALRQEYIRLGLCRSEVNRRVGIVKRMFKWAASMEMVPPTAWHGLSSVAGLRRGRSEARETMPVRPVPEADVEKTLPHLLPHIAAMMRFLQLTGARVGEACAMRPADLDRSAEVWLFALAGHKTAHHGKPRIIAIGPAAQAALLPYLEGLGPEDFVFSPARAMAERSATLRAARKSKVPPSQSGTRKGRKARSYADCYDPRAVHHAVQRACNRAGVSPWHPHQLRHNAATRLRAIGGIELARAALGHSTIAMTAHYAEADAAKVAEVMRTVG